MKTLLDCHPQSLVKKPKDRNNTINRTDLKHTITKPIRGSYEYCKFEKMFVQTQFSLIFTNSLPSELKFLDNKEKHLFLDS